MSSPSKHNSASRRDLNSGHANKGLSSSRKAKRKAKQKQKMLARTGVGKDESFDWQSRPLFFSLLTILLWFFASATIIYRAPRLPYDYVEGQEAQTAIHTEVEFEYVDHEETKNKRRLAGEKEPLIFNINQEVKREQLALLDQLYDSFFQSSEIEGENNREQGVEEELVDEKERPSGKSSLFPPALENVERNLQEIAGPGELSRILGRDDWKNALEEAVRRVFEQGIRPSDRDELFNEWKGPREQLRILDPDLDERLQLRRLEEVPTTEEAVEKVRDILRAQLVPVNEKEIETAAVIAEELIADNLEFNREKTEEFREIAAGRVDKVTRSLTSGEVLVERGETVTAEDLEKLRIHHRQMRRRGQKEASVAAGGATAALLLVLVLGLGGGLVLFDRPSMREPSRVVLIFILVLGQLLISRLAIHVFEIHDISSFYLLAALPTAVAAVFAAQLLNLRLAIWITIFTSLIAALQADNSLEVLIAGNIAGFSGALLVYPARRRVHMFRAGVWLGLAFFFTAAVFWFNRTTPAEAFAWLAVVALVNGLGTTILASTAMPFFEYVFGVVTDISLLEMSDLNHPLLRRLQIEAPGTFHHSLMVAILAEQAASSIEANPLLARVCAYFHDIGKISQAEYFTENTIDAGERDAHSNLQPRMSSLIILNHVKEGLALAAENKLNKTLREAIAQHHGTSLIYYFFHRAAQQKSQPGREKKPPGQHDYRYPGPLPKRKEVVLIGLADACEAAARAMEKPTPQKMESLVGEIISSKLHDGQLDQADLTFQELALVRQAITKTLSTMYHSRTPYPEEQETKNNENKMGQSNQKTKGAEPGKNGRNG